jgi:hypothetical protein
MLSAAASRGSTRAGCSSRSTNADKLFGFHWTKVQYIGDLSSPDS